MRKFLIVMALVVMSNHIHLVLRTTRKNLAAFMGYFKARVAESINHLTGRRGPLWARRYDAQPILDHAAAAGRVGYTLDNPRKANLVEDFEQWPGLNLAYGIGGQMTARIGKKKPSYIGFYYAFRGLVARDPFPGKQMPTCAGPCDTATSPSAWDTAAFFNFGVVFSR